LKVRRFILQSLKWINGEGTHFEDREMACVVFLVFFTNAIFPPLLPSLAKEFGVRPLDLKWLVPAFAALYGVATLVYGTLSDRYGRRPTMQPLLYLATVAIACISLAGSAHQLVMLRAISGIATGGIVTIALSTVGDRYPYEVQGRPMAQLFGAIAAGMGFGVSLGPIFAALLG
jgi:MFS family permease